MKSSFGKFWMMCGLLAAMQMAPAATAQEAQSTLNYPDADIRSFINIVAQQTGKSFVVGPQVNGKVTIISPPEARLSKDEVWEVFLATMQVKGYSVLPITDGEYKIVPTELSTRLPGTNGKQPSGGEVITRIVQLNYVDSRTASNSLKGLIGERAIVTPVVESNSLILVDTAANISRVLTVIDDIDTDKNIVRSVPLQNAIAGEVAEVLKDLISSSSGEGSRAGSASIVAVDASNTVVLRGNPQEINRLLPVIRDLDLSGTSKIDLSVLRLNHASAEEIVPILQEMIDKTFTAEAGSGGRSPSIVFHQPTNSLIINADGETQRIIQSVVRQLDIRRPQVLIEAIVVNLSDNIARDLGVQYILGGDGDNGIPFTSNTSASARPNLLTAAGAAFLLDNQQQDTTQTDTSTNVTNTVLPGTSSIIDAAIGSLLGVSGFTLGGGGTTSDGTFFAAILTAVQNDTDSNVLSTPFAVTLDNQTARLQVGQEIPITTGESLGGDFSNTFRTVERQEVGVILEVTPQINQGNTIKLDITQEVSSINGALTAANADFVINKAEVTTSALADNGEILILGGLIDDNRQISETKVPILGDIPLAGKLFQSSSRTKTKSTLMVFIKPTILRDKQTAEQATLRKYEYARRQQILKDSSGQPSIDLLVEEYLGIGPSNLPSPTYELDE